MEISSGVKRSHLILQHVTTVLSTSSIESLPYAVPALVLALENLPDAFSDSEKTSHERILADSGVLFHKYKTQITTLLLGKRVEGHWVAPVLIKATIDADQHTFLMESKAWIRALLAILGVRSIVWLDD